MHIVLASLGFASLLPAAALLGRENADQAEIRLAREKSNRAMAEHNVTAFGASLAQDYVGIFGDGAFIGSREECMLAFAQSGDGPKSQVVTYERVIDKIEVQSSRRLAAEHGHWIGRLPDGREAFSGSYLAMWRREKKEWKIRSELFVTLS